MLYPDNINLVARDVDPIEVRMRIGMVFQKPNPFPKSRSSRTSPTACACAACVPGRASTKKWRRRCAARRCGTKSRIGCRTPVCRSRAASSSACASRARWRPNPEILLFDEPTSALDPIATARIEELITTLREQVTVSHRHAQHAAGRAGVRLTRPSCTSANLVEFDETSKIFTNPSQKATEDYITGRYG